MSDIFLSLSVIGVGALLGMGFRWGFWISDSVSGILRDIRDYLFRYKP